MKSIFITLLLFAFILSSSCNSLDYKYSDKEDTIICEEYDVNTKLLKEALYSFENDLRTHYTRKLKSLPRGYINYINLGITDSIPSKETISDYSRLIFELLKDEKDLWIIKNGKHKLNYNSSIVTCISDNIMDKGLKATFNALLSTNNMHPRLIGPAIQSKINVTITDKHIATFIALDMFYARLFDVDFTEN